MFNQYNKLGQKQGFWINIWVDEIDNKIRKSTCRYNDGKLISAYKVFKFLDEEKKWVLKYKLYVNQNISIGNAYYDNGDLYYIEELKGVLRHGKVIYYTNGKDIMYYDTYKDGIKQGYCYTTFDHIKYLDDNTKEIDYYL